MADGAKFQAHQRVRVREESREGSQPDKRLLGKEGTIRYSMGTPLEGGLLSFYFVEFDGGEVESISHDWLESAYVGKGFDPMKE